MFARTFIRAMLGLLAAACVAQAGADAPYPSRVVHMVVTYPPGGASDLMARLLADKLGAQWKQTVIVDNHPGAGGSIGTDWAARQPADGYTFLLGNMGPSLINPLLLKVPFDLNRDFVPVSLIGTAPVVLVVNAKSPYKTFQDLLAAARAKPGKLNFGSGGTGSLAQLTGEMLNFEAHVQMTHVPYKGGIAAINDLMASQIDMIAADPQAVIQQIKGGQLRALAVSSAQRFPLLPNVPTFVESGLPGMVVVNSWAVYLPARTPPAAVAIFEANLAKALKDPDLVRRYAELGVAAASSTGDALKRFNAGETAKYAKIIKERNIRAE